jgi:hypothetical protein
MDLNELGRKVLHVIQLAGVPILEGQIRMIDQGVPHRPSSLPKGTVGIYLFFFQDECLKIGKAGSKSNARFLSQHYNPESPQIGLNFVSSKLGKVHTSIGHQEMHCPSPLIELR